MRKLSEIIELAMPGYEEKARCFSDHGWLKDDVPFFCVQVRELHELGNITALEREAFRDWIYERLQGHNTLHSYLKARGKTCDIPARLRWYKTRLRELKAEGR